MALPLHIDELTKIYKLARGRRKVAVDSLSLEVPQGIIFGFLGPNGAGKTTTIKTVLDFIKPTGGEISIFGQPTTDPQTRRLIGYLPEQPYFHKFLKPAEVVCMHAALAGVPRAEIEKRSMYALERAGIAEYADTPISKLSKGLTQRVGIAQALVAGPELLILDEPTSGLDPIGRRRVRDLLAELRDEGKTIFLSSHLLGEVEDLCDVVAVMKEGRLVASGAPDSVRSSTVEIRVHTTGVSESLRDRMKFVNLKAESRADESVLSFRPEDFYNVVHLLEQEGLPVLRVDTVRESLEEAFLRLAA